jgi:hypothetical protein
MRSFFLIATAFMLILLSPLALAVRVSSIYQAEIPVASQSPQEKAQAIQEGLARVLIKVSGNSQVLASYPTLKPALNHADVLAQQFNYKSPANAPKDAPYLLTIHFDPEGVNRLLRDAGSPIWGRSRPLILAWLAFEGPGHPADLVDSSPSDVQKALKHNAEQRGLPIILPTMDVADLNQVTASAVTGKSIAMLQQAAKRYAPKAILVGNINQPKAGLESQWLLVMGKEQWNWNIKGASLQEIFASVVNNVADTLAGKYGAVLSEAAQSEVVLKIAGVKQQTDLMSLMKYLQHLTVVADVQLTSITGSDIVLSVSLRGSKPGFMQALTLGKKLEALNNSDAQDALNYRWLS